MQREVLDLLAVRNGHFLLESGHHGDLWLELEWLCSRPNILRPLAVEVARRLQPFGVEYVCGPLVEGAFIGLLVASELDIPFSYSERVGRQAEGELFPVGYCLPKSFRESVRGKRVAVVNDAINAGSAVRGTFDALEDGGASVIAIGALLVLGSAAQSYADGKGVELASLAALPNTIWTSATCPLCRAGVSLEDVAGFGAEQMAWRASQSH